jgi:DNA-binding NarL/FixJ family response regulator
MPGDRAKAVANRATRRPLPNRQEQVLFLTCEGMTAREVGAELLISSRTVEWHLAQLAETFGVSRKSELIRIARMRWWAPKRA